MTIAAPAYLSLAQILQPEYARDPYPLYHRLREEHPIYWDEQLNGWVLTRYADVIAALHDQRLSSERLLIDANWFPAEAQHLVDPPIRVLERQMIFRDPPEHTRLRGPWNRMLTNAGLEALRGRVQALVAQLLDGLSDRANIDIMREFALPLPDLVVMELLGIPHGDREQFIAWTMQYAYFLDGKIRTRKGIGQVLRGITELVAYFRRVIARREHAPGDDLLQDIINASRQQAFDEDELLANCILFLAAGHESTSHLIGNCLLVLHERPALHRLVREDPGRIAALVTETLRYDSPVQLAGRIAKDDLTIGGIPIHAGQVVFACLGAANRDPEQFPEPDRFILDRPNARSLAFGHGAHFCLGARLAQLQAQIALDALVRRYPAFRLDTTTMQWDIGLSARGLTRLAFIV